MAARRTDETDFDFENETVKAIEKEIWRLFVAINAAGKALKTADGELDREQCRKRITVYGSRYAHALNVLTKRKAKLDAEAG